jgi:hypothetical protein
MRGSLRNVVGFTRSYALPLTTLFWAPNTRSVQHDQLCYLSFERLAHFVGWSAPSYTARDSHLNRLQAFYSFSYTTVCHIINTGSRQITEVKQCRARSVVGWVTAVKTWFNLPFTKMPRVVYTVAEGLGPDRCCNLGSPMET